MHNKLEKKQKLHCDSIKKKFHRLRAVQKSLLTRDPLQVVSGFRWFEMKLGYSKFSREWRKTCKKFQAPHPLFLKQKILFSNSESLLQENIILMWRCFKNILIWNIFLKVEEKYFNLNHLFLDEYFKLSGNVRILFLQYERKVFYRNWKCVKFDLALFSLPTDLIFLQKVFV